MKYQILRVHVSNTSTKYKNLSMKHQVSNQILNINTHIKNKHLANEKYIYIYKYQVLRIKISIKYSM